MLALWTVSTVKVITHVCLNMFETHGVNSMEEVRKLSTLSKVVVLNGNNILKLKTLPARDCTLGVLRR